MTGWWNSVDAVGKFNTWMQVAIVIFGVLAAVATALTIIAAKRISELQAAEATQLRLRLATTERTAAVTHQQLIPRVLTQVQMTRLTEVLGRSPAKARIPVIATESQETRALASQVVRVLAAAGWNTEPDPGTASPAWTGIILTVENSNQIPPTATLLANELRNEGLAVTITDRPGAPKIKTLEASKTLNANGPKLDLLNLWIGEKAPVQEVP